MIFNELLITLIIYCLGYIYYRKIITYNFLLGFVGMFVINRIFEAIRDSYTNPTYEDQLISFIGNSLRECNDPTL